VDTIGADKGYRIANLYYLVIKYSFVQADIRARMWGRCLAAEVGRGWRENRQSWASVRRCPWGTTPK
jgi:hypothetical protein